MINPTFFKLNSGELAMKQKDLVFSGQGLE